MSAPRKRYVLLDNSSVGLLFDIHRDSTIPETLREKAIARIDAEVNAGRLSVILSYALLDELAGTYDKDPRNFARAAVALFDWGRNTFLRFPNDRIRAEIKLKGPLLERDLFFPPALVEIYQDNYLENRALLRTLIKRVANHKRDYLRDSERVRDEAIDFIVRKGHANNRKFKVTGVPTSGEAWRAEADSWTVSMLDRTFKPLGFKPGLSKGLRPHSIRTLWFSQAYTFSRVHDEVALQRKPKEGDGYDHSMFMEAAYTDIFVLDDKDFRHRIERFELGSPRIMQLHYWIAELLDPDSGLDRAA